VLLLNAKGVDYEIINCALMDKPDWLFAFNPLGTVVYIFSSE
jgi:glutathione S-transferase